MVVSPAVVVEAPRPQVCPAAPPFDPEDGWNSAQLEQAQFADQLALRRIIRCYEALGR